MVSRVDLGVGVVAENVHRDRSSIYGASGRIVDPRRREVDVVDNLHGACSRRCQ